MLEEVARSRWSAELGSFGRGGEVSQFPGAVAELGTSLTKVEMENLFHSTLAFTFPTAYRLPIIISMHS